MQAYVDRLCEEIGARGRKAESLSAALPQHCRYRFTLAVERRVCCRRSSFGRYSSVLRGEFDLAADAEITLECAPGQLADETLDELLRQGMNRISFGVQSFVDRETAAVGRLHTRQQCEAEIARRSCGGR